MRMRLHDPSETAWRQGRLGRGFSSTSLLFGRMYEDWRIERGLLAGQRRVFAIASAGCTAFALAAEGSSVTAVDINPTQVAYVRDRLAGGPIREGAAERLMRRGRALLQMLRILPRDLLREFLMLGDPVAQSAFWRDRLGGRKLRLALGITLSRPVLRMIYIPEFLSAVPPGFARVVRLRMERAWQTHPNRQNPYAWRMFLGEDPPEHGPAAAGVFSALECADAAEYLEGREPASFDLLTLSNILDGASPAYANRLAAAVRRCAAHGSVVVLRSFGEPQDTEAERWAAADRSILWGSVRVCPAADFTGS
jgi:S-adenosylmethionine:diacylglycerol 3-amino-3-carboxypropyl transferase